MAGYPDPRASPTITPFHVHAYLFGGSSRTLAGADPTECFTSLPAPADCVFHHHVHSFTPSSLPQAFGAANGAPQYLPGSLSASVWQQLGDAGVGGAPGITGRVLHAAGAMGNQLYVYGGVTAQGPVTELWAFNLFSETWAMVAPSSPAPAAGRVTGEVVGFHFYVYSQPPLGASTPGQLWRWRPAASAGGAPAAAGGYSAAFAAGHTAGIVIGILTGLANLYCLGLLVAHAGVSVLPEWAERLPGVGPLLAGGARARGAAPGFYSASGAAASAGGVQASGGGYAPPPDL